MKVVTIAERRAAELARVTAAATFVLANLEDYGRRRGVNFVIFGSFARGDFIASSDLDLMIEGPDEELLPARDFAEDCCERNGLRHDIHLRPQVSDALMMRIRRDGRRLP